MAELYVGNVSKQIQQFAYRALEKSGIIIQTVPIGGQVRVAPNGPNVDLTTPEIDYIINQHRMYGLVSVDEIKARGKLSGLVYSIGKPISEDKLRRAIVKLEDELDERGRELRKEAALSVNSQIETHINAPLRNLEMSFEEEEPRGGYANDLEHLAEGVRVTRTDASLPSVNGRRRRA